MYSLNGLYAKDKKERTHRLEPHLLKPVSRKETTVQPTKATEGSSEKVDTHTQAKPTQSPRKPQYSQRGRPRGSKERDDTHTQAKNSEPRRPQYSQQRRPRETHLNHTKKDRNEESPTTLPIRPLAPHWCWKNTAPSPRPKKAEVNRRTGDPCY